MHPQHSLIRDWIEVFEFRIDAETCLTDIRQVSRG